MPQMHAHRMMPTRSRTTWRCWSCFPTAGASAVAVALNGGSWFDPGTWSTGKVPGDGAEVYIPEGISVVYDAQSDARLDRIGVDGGLHFAVDTDTKLVVDTLLTSPSRSLTIGVEGNPVRDRRNRRDRHPSRQRPDRRRRGSQATHQGCGHPRRGAHGRSGQGRLPARRGRSAGGRHLAHLLRAPGRLGGRRQARRRRHEACRREQVPGRGRHHQEPQGALERQLTR